MADDSYDMDRNNPAVDVELTDALRKLRDDLRRLSGGWREGLWSAGLPDTGHIHCAHRGCVLPPPD